jgi:hypothetical protein
MIDLDDISVSDGYAESLREDEGPINGFFECPCGHTDSWIGAPPFPVKEVYCPQCKKESGLLYPLPDLAIGIIAEWGPRAGVQYFTVECTKCEHVEGHDVVFDPDNHSQNIYVMCPKCNGKAMIRPVPVHVIIIREEWE